MSLGSGRLSAIGIGHRIPLQLRIIWSSHCPSLSVIISHLDWTPRLAQPHYHPFWIPPVLDFYYISFPRDRRNSKLLVYGVYLVECIQTALITHDALRYFGSGFGDLQNLDRVQWLWIDTPILSGIGEWLRTPREGFRAKKVDDIFLVLLLSERYCADILCLEDTYSRTDACHLGAHSSCKPFSKWLISK